MPIRFPCPYCEQRLSVGTRKAGTEANCPKCKQTIRVPKVDPVAANAEAHHREAAAKVQDDEPSGEPLANASLFEEFVVYDDDGPLVADDVEVVAAPQPDENVDYSKVAVPRWVLFTQALLLGVVGLVCFVLGLVVGAGSSASTVDQGPQPCVITGEVLVSRNGTESPDVGSVIIVLPQNAHPEQKIDVSGLSPLSPEPLRNHRGVAAIRDIGGAYVRVDSSGRYRLRLPDRGQYFVLIISQAQRNPDPDSFDVTSTAQIGRYFDPALELTGDQSYVWQSEAVRSDRSIDHVFR